jgi:hypothetical protein
MVVAGLGCPGEAPVSRPRAAAYRLSPVGQTFTQPVQLSFAYADIDLQGTAPEALGIAFQDGRGLWAWQPAVALDTTAKRLSVMTTHFTDWSNVEALPLRPASTTVAHEADPPQSAGVRRRILLPSHRTGSYLRSATRSFIGMMALSVILMCSGQTSVQHLVMLQ